MILIFPCDRNIVSKILNIKAKYTNLRDERRVIFMRVTKLVIGILMIVYSVWLFIQGLLGGFLGIIADKNMLAGILGILLCGLFMASGIVYISTENSDGLGGDIAGFAMMIVARILGFFGALSEKHQLLLLVYLRRFLFLVKLSMVLKVLLIC